MFCFLAVKDLARSVNDCNMASEPRKGIEGGCGPLSRTVKVSGRFKLTSKKQTNNAILSWSCLLRSLGSIHSRFLAALLGRCDFKDQLATAEGKKIGRSKRAAAITRYSPSLQAQIY